MTAATTIASMYAAGVFDEASPSTSRIAGKHTPVVDSADPTVILYTMVSSMWKKPSIVVSSPSDNTTVGTGSLHMISINAEYTINDHPGTLTAYKRLMTGYTYPSYAFSHDHKEPVTMFWTGSCGLLTYNEFTCTDEHGQTVAKFRHRPCCSNKLIAFEFIGDMAETVDARDEIVVTGLTLALCVAYRTISPPALLGSIFMKTKTTQAQARRRDSQCLLRSRRSGSSG